MNFTKLVVSVFYKDLLDGLKLFVDCLQFLNKVTLWPWGAKEFAIADMQLGIRFQQW
ncbi:MAG TPA: hypothetical protein PLJ08_14825 [Cyclobacteriaceae bacterium]|nr:hypothetical protein [Cyclobacteriaceae bacterium]